MTAAIIEKKIKNYTYIRATLEELREQLDGLTYKTTSSLRPDATGGGNSFTSKVETYGEREIELLDKIAEKEKQLAEIEHLLNSDILDTHESSILKYLANNSSLSGYARRNKICTSYVYKIRDRALVKLAANSTKCS